MFELLIPSYVSLLCAGAFSIFFTWMAFLGGFFKPIDQAPISTAFGWRDMVALFLIFYFSFWAFSYLILIGMNALFPENLQIDNFAISHIFVYLIVMAIFLLYTSKNTRNLLLFWNPRPVSLRQVGVDALAGLICFIISLPVVFFVSALLEIVTFHIFGSIGNQQDAVNFLLMAKDSKTALIFALLSIIVFAPFIEEFLFRGMIHGTLRKTMTPLAANIITSLIFSLSHFSKGQGVANIILVGTLFTLSLYFGYIFERQRSLVAPFVTHMTFNFISTLRIIGTEMMQ